MSTTAVICEYNPFHHGHAYHLAQARALSGCQRVFCLMSGNFTQRGEPAILPKHLRASFAVQAGADCVAELPPMYACSYAESFAYHAVRMLNTLPDVKHLAFGIEGTTLDALQKLSELLLEEPTTLSQEIKKQLENGISFPKAQALAVKKMYGNIGVLLDSANNILAIEYLKALRRLNSDILPLPVPRVGDCYHTVTPTCPTTSASAIRNLLRQRQDAADYVPAYVDLAHSMDQDQAEKRLYLLFLHALAEESPIRLARFCEIKDDFAYKLYQDAVRNADFSSFISAVKTKCVTRAAINRMILHVLTDHTKSKRDQAAAAVAWNVLAYRDKPDEIIGQNHCLLSYADYSNAQGATKLLADDILKTDRLYHLINAIPLDDARSFFSQKVSD